MPAHSTKPTPPRLCQSSSAKKTKSAAARSEHGRETKPRTLPIQCSDERTRHRRTNAPWSMNSSKTALKFSTSLSPSRSIGRWGRDIPKATPWRKSAARGRRQRRGRNHEGSMARRSGERRHRHQPPTLSSEQRPPSAKQGGLRRHAQPLGIRSQASLDHRVGCDGSDGTQLGGSADTRGSPSLNP